MRRPAILMLVLLAGCGEKAPPPKPVTGTWSGLAAAIKAPTSVDAWTIAGNPTKEKSYFEYAESSKAQRLDAAAIQELWDIFSDPKSFSDNPKPCEPLPGVKLRYTRQDGEPIWIFICFDCAEMFIYESGTRRESKEIDPCEKPLGAVMKKIFPKDVGIQRLK